MAANLCPTASKSTKITPRHPWKLAPLVCFQTLVGWLRQTIDLRFSAKAPTMCLSSQQGGRSCATARPPVAASAGAPALAGSPSIRAFVAKSVLTRITRYWIHYFQLFSATSTVKMPVFMKNYKFCWQNCKKNDVYVAKICNGKIRCFCRENLQTRALR